MYIAVTHWEKHLDLSQIWMKPYKYYITNKVKEVS